MNIKRSTAVLAVAIGAVLTPTLFGQATASATIQGTVSDKTAAVIPGAEVKLTGKGTGFGPFRSTNDMGVYRFDLVPPGNYEVRVKGSNARAADSFYAPALKRAGRPEPDSHPDRLLRNWLDR